ncbi:hypothetical protein TNCV_460471 [Trichonephila clavipes]|nr:hypothetical protein TNCV_460471 [Trichonephila clavipes]
MTCHDSRHVGGDGLEELQGRSVGAQEEVDDDEDDTVRHGETPAHEACDDILLHPRLPPGGITVTAACKMDKLTISTTDIFAYTFGKGLTSRLQGHRPWGGVRHGAAIASHPPEDQHQAIVGERRCSRANGGGDFPLLIDRTA